MPGSRTSFADHDCGFAQAVEAIGDQWCLLVLRNLFMGMTRFDDFAEHLSISTKTLSNRLQRLESHGLIEASRDPEDGRGKIYQLTEKGQDLAPLIGCFTQWGERWVPKENGPRTELFEVSTGEPIERITAYSRDGRKLEPHEIDHRTGPGGSDVRDRLDRILKRREVS